MFIANVNDTGHKLFAGANNIADKLFGVAVTSD
jgi:hypothetical protein